MIYRLLADGMMILHGAFLLFFVVGGFLAWRWRRVIWAHSAVGLWNITIVLLDFECPVTGVEKHWMRKGGEEPYAGGYIKHYLDGTDLAGRLHLAGRDHRLRPAGDLVPRPVLRQSAQPANQGRVSGQSRT